MARIARIDANRCRQQPNGLAASAAARGGYTCDGVVRGERCTIGAQQSRRVRQHHQRTVQQHYRVRHAAIRVHSQQRPIGGDDGSVGTQQFAEPPTQVRVLAVAQPLSVTTCRNEERSLDRERTCEEQGTRCVWRTPDGGGRDLLGAAIRPITRSNRSLSGNANSSLN